MVRTTHGAMVMVVCKQRHTNGDKMNNVSLVKIALAGAPMVGKTTILQCFATRTQHNHLTTACDETKRIVQLDMTLPRLQIHFITASGAFVNPDAVIPRILTGVGAVVFVVAASGGSEQQRVLAQYAAYAASVGTHWSDIPWMFVLNKVDLSHQNPLLAHIPPQFHGDIIRCVAREDNGVEQLWQKILEVVLPTP